MSSVCEALPGGQRAQKPSTVLFYTAIRDEYQKMISVKRKGVRMLNQDYVFAVLGEKYFRSPKTIENIIFNRV